MALTSLLGPPEPHNPTLLAKPPRNEATHGVSDPFMDLMVANFNEATVASMRPPLMGHTEKSSPTYLSSGNPCLPHEIISALNDDDGGQVAELQWKKRKGDDNLQKKKLKNCMAICDVSNSMNGTPMEASIEFGMLVSKLSEKPWKGKLITFSEKRTLQMVRGDSLTEKTEFVRRMEGGTKADFQKVLDLILQVAVNGKLKEEEMIKRVFVFSDLEFDKASSTPYETDYKVLEGKFREKGYGNVIPEVVLWNLRDSVATPVPATKKGVALVSGYSENLMKLFMDGDVAIDPLSIMEAAISGEKYQKLAVLD